MDDRPILGIILGDAAGIGPELIAKLAANGFLERHCRPVLLGDARVFELGMRSTGARAKYTTISSLSEAAWGDAIPILDQRNLEPGKDFVVGQVSEKSGKACVDMIGKAVELFNAGEIQGFCFAPFNKAAMKLGGIGFESEHHLLAHIFGYTGPFGEINVLGDLWATRTTSHIPIKDVSAHLTLGSIGGAIRLLHESLVRAGLASPRIGVAALNPHAGENGHCGREEIDVIAPAIELARKAGIDAKGPYPSDILFIKAFDGEFDGVVTMYHDQGQIALKLKGFDAGITIAGGCPAPVATCSHGTAYDIAGKGIAKTDAFENAIIMASKMASHAKADGGGKGGKA